MRIPCLLLAVSLNLAAAAPSENPRDLVRKAIENYERDAMSALHYTYTATDTGPKGTEVMQVMSLEGTPYDRLIAKDGRPLTLEEDKRQQEKYEAAASERASETPEERAKRIRKYQEQREFVRYVPDAFDFKMLPGEMIEGRSNYVIQCIPKPGYEAPDPKARMFSKLDAKIWIDKEDLRMSKAEANITGTISIGFVLARIAKGGHIEFTQTRVANDVWLPRTIDLVGCARILLVDDKKIDEQVVYRDFKPVSRVGTKALAQTALR